jgi:SAM-dependent methyltransferase
LLQSAKTNNLLWKLRARLHTRTVLEERASAIAGPMQVIQCGPERQLVLGQSTNSLYYTNGRWGEARREYWGAMSESPFGIPAHARVLLLGLGGGTTLHLLQRRHRPASVTALEIDPLVIQAARRHFAIDAIEGLSIIESDATAGIRALRAQGARFDLILDDVLYKVTGKLSRGHQAVVKDLFAMLHAGGSVTFQRLIDTRADEVDAERFMQSLREMGHEVRVRKIRHRWANDVLYCRPAET